MFSFEIAYSQSDVHPTSTLYEYPKETGVAEKLEQWRDQKFGIIIHWGVYAVPGIIESWSICSEDWIYRDSTSDYNEYKKWYWGQAEKFNPTKFNPDSWAEAAKAAGMKYVVFTTKHHDGFNMFDTKYSNYKITNGPFKGNPKANVAKEVFDAFRRKEFMIGAYFSKPDWHSEYFWWPRYATPNRNVNYDIRKFPWRWNEFKKFTFNQLNELSTDYGKLDILWLDGGWVRPRNTVTDEVISWGAPIPDFDQQIEMPKIAKMVRDNQKDILIVDRTVHGEYENYKTPEQGIPNTMSTDPWESCITLGGAWGYLANDNFKSASTVIHTLIEIVAKGGNLLLGVGPTPEGEFLKAQTEILAQIGNWLTINGDAIYNTRAIANFKSGDIYFTKGKENSHYAILSISKEKPLTEIISWKGNEPKANSKIMILGQKEIVKWKTQNEETILFLTKKQVKMLSSHAAIALKFEL